MGAKNWMQNISLLFAAVGAIESVVNLIKGISRRVIARLVGISLGILFIQRLMIFAYEFYEGIAIFTFAIASLALLICYVEKKNSSYQEKIDEYIFYPCLVFIGNFTLLIINKVGNWWLLGGYEGRLSKFISALRTMKISIDSFKFLAANVESAIGAMLLMINIFASCAFLLRFFKYCSDSKLYRYEIDHIVIMEYTVIMLLTSSGLGILAFQYLSSFF